MDTGEGEMVITGAGTTCTCTDCGVPMQPPLEVINVYVPACEAFTLLIVNAACDELKLFGPDHA